MPTTTHRPTWHGCDASPLRHLWLHGNALCGTVRPVAAPEALLPGEAALPCGRCVRLARTL